MSRGCTFYEPSCYQIRVQGILGRNRSSRLAGFTVTTQADDETLLSGMVKDQLALHSLLAEIGDLGLPLLSLERVEFQ